MALNVDGSSSSTFIYPFSIITLLAVPASLIQRHCDKFGFETITLYRGPANQQDLLRTRTITVSDVAGRNHLHCPLFYRELTLQPYKGVMRAASPNWAP